MVQSEADQKNEGESEVGQKEESGKAWAENSPGECEEEEPKKKKKSQSEYTPIRRSRHEPKKNQQRLSIPEKGKSHQNTPISSDLVSNISLSPSERSSAQTTEVPIDTETTAVSTPYEEQDETMAAKK